MKQQLKSGKATLGDMTSRRWSLMTSAIRGGSKEVVEFLLDNGIDVNMAFGENQTSPLQWAITLRKLDIVEVLVSRGADVNHITAYGTDLEVLKVIKLGADLMTKQHPLGWPAIFHTVYYGNMETLVELMRHYPQSIIFDKDERGWTLLHIAASAGHRDITPHLLEAGSNPYAESRPFFSHIPECIWGKRCTPAEVAAAQSLERLVQYEELLEGLGIRPTAILLSDNEEDEFWDAEEFIS
ncbi:ankyrin unc44 [Colletotrichum camelliae]|nr:ankyrin unc44 [Colletotrichum camelliae]